MFGFIKWKSIYPMVFILLSMSFFANAEKQANPEIMVIPAKEVEIKVEVGFKPASISDKGILPFKIIVEPADTEKADKNIPRWLRVPQGLKAYRIFAENSSGEPIGNDKIKGAFALGLGYPEHIKSGLERGLRLFVLHRDRWIPVKSQLDLSKHIVKTESAKQFGIYRLLAPAADIDPQKDIYVYPNPVQFGGLEELNFRNVPGGSVVEIYTVSGEQIVKFDVPLNPDKVTWNGKKDDDEIVTSGLYLYRVNMTRDEAFGKIVVKR